MGNSKFKDLDMRRKRLMVGNSKFLNTLKTMFPSTSIDVYQAFAERTRTQVNALTDEEIDLIIEQIDNHCDSGDTQYGEINITLNR